MIALGYICDWFEKVGAVNFHRSSSVRKDKLQSVYVFFNSAVMVVFLSAHMLSTFTRAIRYSPEFFQALVEDLVLLLVTTCIFEFEHKYRQLGKLNDVMEYSFTQAYPKIRNKCMRESRVVFHSFSAITLIALSGSFIETMLPISESDLEIQRYVYRTKHTERQLPYKLRVPFLDETESWSYEILYVFSSYALFCYWIWSSLISSLTPILLIHGRGQYAILCKYVTMIGAEHRDSQGNRIYYTSIEKNEYVFKMDTKDKNQNRRYNEIYERLFLRQIVLFHQKLLLYRSEVINMLTVSLYAFILAEHLIIALCLYQTVMNPTETSPLQYFKFIAELIAIVTGYFIICSCSEYLDECSACVRQALIMSNWHTCTSATRKDLIMLIRRVQIPHHVTFCKGLYVVNRILFAKTIKFGYTFVNFMGIESK